MHKISIPKGARAVLLNLRYENHEAYVVGGCVRDSLLGKEPKDWDICTSATPDEVKELMHRRGTKTIDTGLQHGTVTVDMDTAGKYEVTTFRIDGSYTDGRHLTMWNLPRVFIRTYLAEISPSTLWRTTALD